MKVLIVPVTSFMQNCTILCCEASSQAAVVDPGGNPELIIKAAEDAGVTISKILLTHAHIDHAGATAELAEQFDLLIEGPHLDDKFWIDALPQQSKMFGFPQVETFIPDRWLKQGDTVSFGEVELEVHHCPGHTPGHVVFFHPASRIAIVGDVLFKGSIGRTDFPKGDHQTLIDSIRTRLWPMGDDVQFVPGHGPVSTFGEERKSNPYVQG